MEYYCEVKETGEVYRSNFAKLVASIASHRRISQDDAGALLILSTIDNPIDLDKEQCWAEESK